MAKNDLRDSARDNVDGLALTLKTVREDLVKLTNYERTLEKRIIDTCELYGIENEELENLKLKIVPEQRNIPFKELFEVFPNYDIQTIAENIVAEIKINMRETETNLRFSANFADPIINAIMKQLEQLTNVSIKEVELK